MNLFKLILFCLLSVSLIAKAETEIGNQFSGSFNFFGGGNFTNYKSPTQNKQYAFIEGSFKFKNFDIINKGNTKYGLTIDLGLNSNSSSNPVFVNEANFAMIVKDRGARLFGLQNSIASKMRVDSTTFAPHTKGVNGGWQNFILYPSNTFITRQGLGLETGFSSTYFLANDENLHLSQNPIYIQPDTNWSNSNLGFSYISDRFSGFRFGIEYAPNNDINLLLEKNNLTDLKNNKDIKNNNGVYLKNIISTGLNYYNAFGDFEVALSATYEFAQTHSNKFSRYDVNSYALGANVSYLGVTFGGSFSNFGKSSRIKNILVVGNNAYYEGENEKGASSSYSFDVGLGYSIDRYTTSVAFLKSNYVDNKFWSTVFSFEVKLVENLVSFAQLARYEFNQNTKNGSEKEHGTVVSVGAKYIF